ncbi:hypothetical protein P152DRAFT_396259 [Eremomyces bilateralis CBS 781.70]|uniref:Uncharacterized protein n=1 Tax=Eremomyces bilateralis CBS 781.70 TaxID=1392243 RepID=A0A6G1G578_9PEZI|nr:uncharacterized protein P152DRAFT_396259 [Eremomyces bilateralis CBS 781.70]KAF1813086.1 hypothetical protein P152DRAFT_396259 [Eremomyces bilateralis CBS 781.70]
MFAPYQDAPPEQARAMSPPLQGTSPRRVASPPISRPLSPPVPTRSPVSYPRADEQSGGIDRGRDAVDLFATKLGLRMDIEACLAYLLLPPAGPVMLLVFESWSDYVRFHAWQSSLLFAFLFIIHIIFSWTSIISYLLLVVDILLIAWLTYRAYSDAETLDRYQIPFFGPLASSIVDDE